jgi:hypothetical protein
LHIYNDFRTYENIKIRYHFLIGHLDFLLHLGFVSSSFPDQFLKLFCFSFG